MFLQCPEKVLIERYECSNSTVSAFINTVLY